MNVITDWDARGVVTLRLNRPAVRNALDDAMLGALTQEIATASRRAEARVIILTGEGEAFCAGTDVSWMEQLARGQPADDARRLANLLFQIRHCPKPVVARINGAAIGAGLAVAVACDIAVADDAAMFALPAVRLGTVPAVIGPFLIAAMGVHHVRRFVLTGESFDAAEARRLGAVHAICHATQLDATVDRFVGDLLAGGPGAQRETKALLNAFGQASLSATLLAEAAKVSARVRRTDEAREGLAAYIERRRPNWWRGPGA